MKNLIIGSVAGLIIGAGGMFGLAHIPRVDAVIGNDNSTIIEESEKVQQLETENSQLKLDISAVTDNLTKAQNQLVEKDNLISAKQNQIMLLELDKQSLQEQLDEALSNTGSTGSSEGNSELIISLQNQLEEKTTALNVANAELEQLRVDKTSLETRVSELETRLVQLEEELAQYKTLGDIDIYNIDSFNGTWYQDGEFKDYYIIDNGVITHNANEDTGAVQNLSNQMYFFMNTNGGLKVNLSSDGNSFTTEDGSIYKKFYINTTETVVANMGDIVGVYSHDNKTLTLNGDNTLSLVDGDDTYYGAFTVSAISKNVGGNIHTTNYISANINLSDTQIQVEYEIVSGSLELEDKTNNIVYSLIEDFSDYVLLTTSENVDATAQQNYGKVVCYVETEKFFNIKPGESIIVQIASNDTTYGFCVNGTSLNSGRFTFKNFTDEPIRTNKFKFYISTSRSGIKCYGFVSIGDCYNFEYTKVESSSSYLNYYLNSEIKYRYENPLSYEPSYVTCGTISDYTNGTYTSDEVNFTLSDGVVTINNNDTVTVTNCEITAKTDGYDIYQTATITYTTTTLVDEVETTTDYIVVVEYKNNLVLSCTLDEELVSISKN